ncbi:MAG: ABC transporter ATP-binding protein [Actinobacteria bacterium]|nr:ABC transporter ATP-binding protein [Actinomycetota bacterium]
MDALRLDFSIALRAFDLELALEVGAETFALVGPSGAGKSTVLRAVAGLTRPDRGSISSGASTWFDAQRRIDIPPERRPVGLVFQDYALFPHLTVEANVAFGARDKVGDVLDRFGIGALAGERPERLSGGERQRVALARALARDPSVLLLDEPLAALDTQTRARVRGELRTHLRATALPTIVVTHDFTDAAALADRIGVLVDGKLVQVGRAAELIAAPATPLVAELAGSNLLPGTAAPRPDGLTDVTLDTGVRVVSAEHANGRVGVIVQPWEISIARKPPEDSMQNHIRAEIESLVPVGNRIRVRLGPLTAEITATSATRLELREGETAVASFKATATRLTPLAGRVE